MHAVEYISEDEQDIVIFAFHQGYCYDAIVPNIYPDGLQADGLYQVEGMEEIIHGSTLMNAGIENNMCGDFDSRFIRIRRIG